MTKELNDIQAAELLGLGYRGGRSIGDLIDFLSQKDGGVDSIADALEDPGELINALYEAVKGVLG